MRSHACQDLVGHLWRCKGPSEWRGEMTPLSFRAMTNDRLLGGAFCQFRCSWVDTFTLTRKLCDLSGPPANQQAGSSGPSESAPWSKSRGAECANVVTTVIDKWLLLEGAKKIGGTWRERELGKKPSLTCTNNRRSPQRSRWVKRRSTLSRGRFGN